MVYGLIAVGWWPSVGGGWGGRGRWWVVVKGNDGSWAVREEKMRVNIMSKGY